MKTKSLSLLALSVFALTLASCGGSSSSTPVIPSASSSSEEVKLDNYFQVDQSKYKLQFNDFRKITGYECEANQKGDVRALVIPVEFEDATADMLPAGREGTLKHIQSSIFGDPETDKSLGWESLSSFYKKSSYGQCNITGKVLDWYQIPYTTEEFNSLYAPNASKLVSELYDYYSEGGEGAAEVGDLADYDANHDGYVDLTLIVYSCKEATGGHKDSIFWAFTTQHNNAGAEPKSEKDALMSRFWFSSYNFMYKDTKPGTKAPYTDEEIAATVDGCIDAHTFIHESGHGMGLADYYSYDSTSGDMPMGGIDMMDNNIGDHCSYSKALYGWISPYVVDGNARITIKPFQESGDAILVPIRGKNWKDTTYHLMDEYLMIEYDTPTGLAKADGEDNYAGNYPIYYNQPGVRVLHTDSRFGAWYVEGGQRQFAQYLTKPRVNDPNYSVDWAHDNTLSRTANGNRLLSVVEPTGKLHLKGVCKNSSLWQAGDFVSNMTMNSQQRMGDHAGETFMLGYSIEIVEITPEGATIEFRVQDEYAPKI